MNFLVVIIVVIAAIVLAVAGIKNSDSIQDKNEEFDKSIGTRNDNVKASDNAIVVDDDNTGAPVQHSHFTTDDKIDRIAKEVHFLYVLAIIEIVSGIIGLIIMLANLLK